jgi:hypothetical protein
VCDVRQVAILRDNLLKVKEKIPFDFSMLQGFCSRSARRPLWRSQGRCSLRGESEIGRFRMSGNALAIVDDDPHMLPCFVVHGGKGANPLGGRALRGMLNYLA